MEPTRTYTEAVRVAVKEAIAQAGTTANAVAAGTGIPQATLSRRLNGSPFLVSELDLIANHLRIPVVQLTAPGCAA
jgi:hypothetical protein